MPAAASSTSSLRFIAGRRMAARLQRDGWSVDHFDLMLGASGGPKWLVLYGLDVALAPMLARRREPLALLGSSIGAWRQACYAQDDPVAAFGRFRAAYLEAPEDDGRMPDFDAMFRRYLDRVLGAGGAAEVVHGRRFVQHIVTARQARQVASMVRAFAPPVARNLLSRRWLGSRALQRAVFSTDPDGLESISGPRWRVGRRVQLTTANLPAALLATAAVPGLLQAVRVPGDDAGHVDGGLFDYHFHPGELRRGLAIVYPHFYPHLVPGWFDRFTRRRVPPAALDNTLLIAPSAAFVSSLPGGRIPDRRDAQRLTPAELLRNWSTVFERSVELGEVFAEQVSSGAFVAALETPA